MQPESRSPSRHRATKINEIAITIRPSTNDGICKHDRIRLAPGDLFAESRPEPRLIGSAGKGRLAAKLEMSFHEPFARTLLLSITANEFGMQQIHGSDIQGGWHANTACVLDETINKIQADPTVIQTAIDVSLRDIQQLFCPDDLCKSDQNVHRERRRRPMLPRCQFFI